MQHAVSTVWNLTARKKSSTEGAARGCVKSRSG